MILFMFLVGCELDLTRVMRNAGTAVVVSYAGIAAPMLLGIALSWMIFQDFAPHGVRFLPFALFVGTAMSITAFPVLARIIAERRLTGTMLGATAIACAAGTPRRRGPKNRGRRLVVNSTRAAQTLR